MSASEADGLREFRQQARAWLEEHVPRLGPRPSGEKRESDGAVARARELQRTLYDAGYAGLAFPSEYGGRGLGADHARAFAEEAALYESPLILQEPTLNIIAPTILDCGTEAQKTNHLPAMLRGEERWIQLLSEPSSGSDVASTLTSATRVDGGYLLNGTKIWSSGADRADWALCPARTDWDVPKHQGLTVFLLPMRQQGIEVHPIRTSDGAANFCQEFITDVFVPDADVLGDVGGGWAVIMTLITHERQAVAGASPYTGGARSAPPVGGAHRAMLDLAIERGARSDPRLKQLIGGLVVDQVVQAALNRRIAAGLSDGQLPASAGTILRLYEGVAQAARATVAVELSGIEAVAWAPDAATAGVGARYLMRQASSIGGGTTEMARNVISERVLGMPRETAPDRGVPFRTVTRNSTR